MLIHMCLKYKEDDAPAQLQQLSFALFIPASCVCFLFLTLHRSLAFHPKCLGSYTSASFLKSQNSRKQISHIAQSPNAP